MHLTYAIYIYIMLYSIKLLCIYELKIMSIRLFILINKADMNAMYIY